jgi:hypothetical protein
LCKGFSKVLIDGYWDRLWILLISHGYLTFVGLSRFDLHNLSTHPPFLYFCCTYICVNYVGARGGHPWHLWDHEFMGNEKEVFDVGAVGHSGVTPPST